MVTRLTIDTPRGQFAVRASGSPDNPLVLHLHGFPDDASTFEALGEGLAGRGFYAVAPFCRGYAPSPLANPDGSRFGKDLFAVLAADVVALADALAPGAPFRLVGHDNGAFTVYHVLALAPERVARAVTLAAAHPATVFRNTSRSPRQLWRSRYAVLFQIPRVSEWIVRHNDFAYVEGLWRRWSPGWDLPPDHLTAVKKTLAASFPAPILHYRSGGFGPGEEWPPLPTPTLYLVGARDGCVLPAMADGQQHRFAGAFRSEVIPDAGHFPHLEQPAVVGRLIEDWLAAT